MAKKKTEEIKEENKRNNKLYFGYGSRLIVNIILLIVFIMGFIYCLSKSFTITKGDLVKYNENSTVDYKVYLKDNDFYEEEYLGKGMAYVASLIDKINVDYHYLFNIDRKSNIDFTYKIVGRLVIKNQNEDGIFFEKEYDLSDEITNNLRDKDNYSIDKNIVIDYDYYNDLANSFKSNYAVNTNSYLEVYMQVNEKSVETKSYSLNNTSKTVLTIPLSKQEINIKLDNKDVNEEKQIKILNDFMISNKNYLIVSIVLLVIIVVLLSKFFTKLGYSSKKISTYDKYISRILRTYDRIIVTVKTFPVLDDYITIELENFEDLVDISDNISQTIKYYVVTKGRKSKFFIIDGNILYLYTIKSVDFGVNN